MLLEVEKKLGILSRVKPREDFRKSLREELMQRVQAVPGERKLGIFDFIISRVSLRNNLLKHAYAPVVAGFIIFIFFFSGTVLAMKAADSLPGEFLYNVKRAGEKAQVGLSFSEADKANKEVNFASKRIEELAKLTIPQEVDKEEDKKEEIKPEIIEKAVKDFHKEMVSVKTRLDSLDRKGDKKAALTAKVVDEMLGGFVDTLEQVAQKEELSFEVKDRIVKAINTLDEVNSQTLGVMIKAENGEGDEFKVLVARLENKIAATEKRIANVDEIVAGKGLVEDKQGVLLSLKKKLELAKIILVEAKESLTDKDLEMALEKVEESKELAQEVDKELALGKEVILEQEGDEKEGGGQEGEGGKEEVEVMNKEGVEQEGFSSDVETEEEEDIGDIKGEDKGSGVKDEENGQGSIDIKAIEDNTSGGDGDNGIKAGLLESKE